MSRRFIQSFIQENFFTCAPKKMNIITQTNDQCKKEIYLNLKNYDNKVAVTKLKLPSYNLATNTAQWYKIPTKKYLDIA